jgi:TPR repeat protein
MPALDEVEVLFKVENICLRPLIRRTRRAFEQCPGQALLVPFVPLEVRSVVVVSGRPEVQLSCACRGHWKRRDSVAWVSDEAEGLYQRGAALSVDVSVAGTCRRVADCFLAASALGHAPAMFWWGQLLSANFEDPVAEAVAWFRKGAERRHVWSRNGLAALLRKQGGAHVAEALMWSRKAAAMGSGWAMRFVGLLYELEEGVPMDLMGAVSWHRKAGEAGNAMSMVYLGGLLIGDHAAIRDPVAAAVWFHKAAVRGSAIAMENLAWMYQSGVGVPVDEGAARAWTRKASSRREQAIARWGMVW